MTLLDVVRRRTIPEPWSEGDKIPWHEAEFSRRMLDVHLSQAHDSASRRFEVIDEHVHWIHEYLLSGQPTRILDLGCGPGLYTERLARLGHQCVGYDVSPAAVGYAIERADSAGLDCRYDRRDIRSSGYGTGYGLVMSIFGEFNVFRPEEARQILASAYEALVPGGRLLLEPHTFDAVVALGTRPASWQSAEKGLFSDRPHLWLEEGLWDANQRVAIQRYFVIDAETGDVVRHSSSMQAYTDEDYRSLLSACGFGDVTICATLGKSEDRHQRQLLVISARKTQDAPLR